jgi:hypothetical protein
VQAPSYSQNFNRYTYALNNPLKYTDPSGKFFILDSWVAGFIDGFFSSGSNRLDNALVEADTRTRNDVKLTLGLIIPDKNKTFGGQVWEIISRVTWQAPQTLGGWLTTQWSNTIEGNINWVDYKYGATIAQSKGSWGAITQGPYIMGDESIETDANNPLFQHEYGHYIQSQSMGHAYYSRVGIPSAFSKGVHDFTPFEQDANRRAFLYFNKETPDFQDDTELWNVDSRNNKGWDFWRNPLNINGSNTRGQYVDYRNCENVTSLDKISISAQWYDHVSWIFIPAPFFQGLYNY